MANYYVESVFDCVGLKCAVLLQKTGHRCGYVGVPESHPLYGKDYDDVNITVHGGLTFSDNYSDYPIETEEKTWWFGFDCAHCDDAMDFDSVIKEMPENTSYAIASKKIFESNPIPGQILWTKDMVEKECEIVATQLIQF